MKSSPSRWYRRICTSLCLPLLLVAFLASVALAADTVRLTDGTELVGEAKKLGSTYQIKTEDGQWHILPADRIESINGKSLGGSPAADSPSTEGEAAPADGVSQAFLDAKRKADRKEVAAEGLTIWELFLKDKSLSARDREEAEKELAVWEERNKSGAEVLRGKWISGEEIAKIKAEADALVEEGLRLEQSSSALDAVRKYREAVRVYPNSFVAHFRLGYLDLIESIGPRGIDQRRAAKAERGLRYALRMDPGNAGTMTNLGVALWFRQKYAPAVEQMWEAVQRAETPVTVHNLLTALGALPPHVFDANSKLREINQRANALRVSAVARSGPRGGGGFIYADWTEGIEVEPGTDQPRHGGKPGLLGNGSGFLVSPDGYILTNRHVADAGPGHYLRVRFEDGTEKLAEVVAIDTDDDIALLKVDTEEPLPYLQILPEDFPDRASQVMVLGYPATGTGAFSMQVDPGTVRSTNPTDPDYEVWFDLSTTNGNSGGPVVDKNGDVVGILSAGRTVNNVTYVLGIGPRQIRAFFERIGDKAPELPEYQPTERSGFDGVALDKQCSPATLLVLIYRGDVPEAGGDDLDEEEIE